MLGTQRRKVQHGRELGHLTDGDALEVGRGRFRAALLDEQRHTVLEPFDLQWSVAFDHRAQNVVTLSFVQRFGEHELIDDRSNWFERGRELQLIF